MTRSEWEARAASFCDSVIEHFGSMPMLTPDEESLLAEAGNTKLLLKQVDKKQYLVFEESEHDDLYERDNDGRFLVDILDSPEKAKALMEEEFKKHKFNEETDTIDKGEYAIEVSCWVKTHNYGTGKDELEHDCDWKWTIEERIAK